MSYFLAIDAGGTKTQCLLADESRVLARAITGSVKLMRVGEDEATTRLKTMLAEVANTAGVVLRQVTRTCFGLAGLSSPMVRTWAEKSIAELVGGELLLCGDEEIALDAAFAGGPEFWLSRAQGRTPLAARLTVKSSTRAAGGPYWATKALAHGSAWKRFARHCARTTASSSAMQLMCKPASNLLPCCARSSGTGRSTRSGNWSLTPTSVTTPITPRRSSPRSRPSLRAAPMQATRLQPKS